MTTTYSHEVKAEPTSGWLAIGAEGREYLGAEERE
jgi:hypothetical protein